MSTFAFTFSTLGSHDVDGTCLVVRLAHSRASARHRAWLATNAASVALGSLDVDSTRFSVFLADSAASSGHHTGLATYAARGRVALRCLDVDGTSLSISLAHSRPSARHRAGLATNAASSVALGSLNIDCTRFPVFLAHSRPPTCHGARLAANTARVGDGFLAGTAASVRAAFLICSASAVAAASMDADPNSAGCQSRALTGVGGTSALRGLDIDRACLGVSLTYSGATSGHGTRLATDAAFPGHCNLAGSPTPVGATLLPLRARFVSHTTYEARPNRSWGNQRALPRTRTWNAVTLNP